MKIIQTVITDSGKRHTYEYVSEPIGIGKAQKRIVGRKGKYGIINNEGEVLVDLKYSSIIYERNFFIVKSKETGKYGILNEYTLRKVNNCQFDEIKVIGDYFLSGLFKVKKDGKYGFIDKLSGKLINRMYYDTLQKIDCKDVNNIVIVSKEGKYNLLSFGHAFCLKTWVDLIEFDFENKEFFLKRRNKIARVESSNIYTGKIKWIKV